jgi:hypothetical protein
MNLSEEARLEEDQPKLRGRSGRIVEEDEEDEEKDVEEAADVVKEALVPRPKRTSIISEATLRRMSSTQAGYGGYGPVRRGRRRAATTQDHAKMCAMVQTKLKLGDIM